MQIGFLDGQDGNLNIKFVWGLKKVTLFCNILDQRSLDLYIYILRFFFLGGVHLKTMIMFKRLGLGLSIFCSKANTKWNPLREKNMVVSSLG